MGKFVGRAFLILAAFVGIGLVLSACATQTPTSHATVEPDTGRVKDSSIQSIGCGISSSPAGQPSVTDSIESGGHERTYVLHVPTNYVPGKATPLILMFHGRGGSGAAAEKFTGFSASDAIVVYPNGLVSQGQTAWESAPYASGTSDVAFVSALITHLQTNLCIDPARIYAAGISNGGGFTSLLACELPDRIAAFGIVAGALYVTPSADCSFTTPAPIIEFHGTADPVIRYGGGTSHGTRYLSVDEWLNKQVASMSCGSEPVKTQIGSDITESAWSGCSSRGDLIHYRVTGGGHTWPGATVVSGPGQTTQTISATALMLSFFASHPRS